jgi:hypothetical protein
VNTASGVVFANLYFVGEYSFAFFQDVHLQSIFYVALTANHNVQQTGISAVKKDALTATTNVL